MFEPQIRLTEREVSCYYHARVPKLKRSPSRWRGPCPIHAGKDDNFAVDPKTGLWFCHSQCSRGGDIFDLEAHLSGGDFRACKARVFSLVGRAERAANAAFRRSVRGNRNGWL